MSITSGLAPIRNYANGGDINTKRQNMLAKLGFPSGMTNEQIDAAIAEEERISSIASGGNDTPIIKDDAQDEAKKDVDDANAKEKEEKTLKDYANDLSDFSKMMAPSQMTKGSMIKSASISIPQISRYQSGGIASMMPVSMADGGFQNMMPDTPTMSPGSSIDSPEINTPEIKEGNTEALKDVEEDFDKFKTDVKSNYVNLSTGGIADLDMMIANQGARKGISAVEQRANMIKKTLAQSGRIISEEDANMFGVGEISFEEAINKSIPSVDMDMIKAERNEMQQQQLGFAEGGDVDTKFFGKDGILFDPSKPTDYALLIPGVGAVGLGVRALTKAPAIIKAANAAFKSAGKAAKKKGFNVRDPKTGKILSDVEAGKNTIIGSTRTGQALRGSVALGLGGKLLPEGEAETTLKEETPPPEPPPEADTRTFFEKLKDVPGDTFKQLQDDPEFRARFLAGSMNMMKPTEGYVPTSGVNQFYDAFENKRNEQVATKLAAAKIAAANQEDSIFDNILAGTDELGSVAVLPTNLKATLFGGINNLVATPAGAQFMGIEPGQTVTDSMMITLVQSLQSEGLSGSNLQQAIKTAIQPLQVSE